MIMRRFAEAVGGFDVYVAPYLNMRGTGRAGGPGRAPGAGGDGARGVSRASEPSPIRDHFTVANLCGYPAVSVPNGFTADGHPTSITFMGRLYNEAQILALARAYQEKAGWYLRRPALKLES
jgi:Asp-tRNA(Asn)/Glu-tRNA(Gln) amidotransferase A subunit family amidase